MTTNTTFLSDCVQLSFGELFSEFDEARDILLDETPSVFSTEAVNLPRLG